MNKEARKYSSLYLKKRLEEVDPILKEEVRIMMSLSARIDDLRQARGWSVEEMEDKFIFLNLEVDKWREGYGDFTLLELIKISNLFGLKTEDLFDFNQKI